MTRKRTREEITEFLLSVQRMEEMQRMVRPTESPALHAQQCARGAVRIHPPITLVFTYRHKPGARGWYRVKSPAGYGMRWQARKKIKKIRPRVLTRYYL